MHGDNIRTRFGKPFDVFFGIYNHQMTIQRQFRAFSDIFHHFDTERDVIDEHAVHNVAMHDIRAVLL